jgi:hypothetical protein
MQLAEFGGHIWLIWVYTASTQPVLFDIKDIVCNIQQGLQSIDSGLFSRDTSFYMQ